MDKHKGGQRKGLRFPIHIYIIHTAHEPLSGKSYIYDQEGVNKETAHLKTD